MTIRVWRIGVKISTKGRYAVMAVVDLTSMSAGQPVPLADIAERQDISLSYLEQLFAKLKKGGVVKSVRGPGGGYMLAAPASTILISTIIKSVDDSSRPVRCSPSSPNQCMPGNQRCATHALFKWMRPCHRSVWPMYVRGISPAQSNRSRQWLDMAAKAALVDLSSASFS